MEYLGKRGPDQLQAREGPVKRPRTSDQRLRGQQGRVQCNMCRKLHYGVCLSRDMGYYKCGRVAHVSRDCPQETSPLCFHYNQVGNKKVD